MALSEANITGIYFLAGTFVTVLGGIFPNYLSNRRTRRDAEARDKLAAISRQTITDHIATVSNDVAAVKIDAAKTAAQTDGMLEKVAALGEAVGVAKGTLAGQKTGEETGKQRAEEVAAVVAEAVDAAGKSNQS